MPLKLYNTFSNQKEEFVPVEKGKVKFYTCGPTVYDYIHVGNARAFIVTDVLRRFLKYLNYDVTYILNLTDIDDKIIERAQKEEVESREITEKYSNVFLEDLKGLGIEPADVYPKATEHVEDIVAMIQKLVDKGFGYAVDGDVFYDVTKFDNYGKLSGKKIDDLIAGARVTVNDKKRNPADFALWKSQKPGEPAWESPWGPGRPGWHIECSAMSMKYLGNSFDIHAGGTDLIFPHHENEIAQSEAVTQKKFVKYWLHNGFLQIDGEKMAKSLGNFWTVRDALKRFPGTVIRMFFLQKHYRSPIDFTEDGLESAESAVSRLKIFVENLDAALDAHADSGDLKEASLAGNEKQLFDSINKMKAGFIEALEDDLNSPVALSYLFDMVRSVNKLLSQESHSENEKKLLARAKADFDKFNAIFGIYEEQEMKAESGLVDDLMSLLIELRAELRNKKEWELADKIRDELSAAGISLQDSDSGTKWRMK